MQFLQLGIGRQELEQPAVPDPTGSMFRSSVSRYLRQISCTVTLSKSS